MNRGSTGTSISTGWLLFTWSIGISLLFALGGLNAGDQTDYLTYGRDLLRHGLRPRGVYPSVSGFPVTAGSLALSERLVAIVCTLPTCVPSLWGGKLLAAVCLFLAGIATAAFLREAGQPRAARLSLLLFPVFPSFVLLIDANASHWTTLALVSMSAVVALRACATSSAIVAAALAVTVSATLLARPEGLVLSALCAVLCLTLPAPGTRLRVGAVYVGSLGVIVALVSLAYIRAGHVPDWTHRDRSYAAFEQGYGYVFPDRIQGSPFFTDPAYAARVYGTAEENGNSIVRVALRRPGPFVERLLATTLQGARTASIVLSVSLPMMACVFLGFLVVRGGQPWRGGFASHNMRAWSVAGALLLTPAPYVLTFYREAYFLPVLWVAVATVSVAVCFTEERLSTGNRTRLQRAFFVMLVLAWALGTTVSILKLRERARADIAHDTRIALVKALAAATSPSSRIWAGSPHWVRYADRTPVAFSKPVPDTCKEANVTLERERPTHLLFEVKDYSKIRSGETGRDLRQLPALLEACGLRRVEPVRLPPSIAASWQLAELLRP